MRRWMMFVAVVTTLAVSIAAPVGALGRWSFSRRPLPVVARFPDNYVDT